MLRRAIGTVGAGVIYALIRTFGRRSKPGEFPWLEGPLGGKTIGDKSYEETARSEGLSLVRNAREGGLIPSFDELRSPSFDPGRVHEKIRDFYENTSAYRLDTWATTYFPANVALWLLVTLWRVHRDQLAHPERRWRARLLAM